MKLVHLFTALALMLCAGCGSAEKKDKYEGNYFGTGVSIDIRETESYESMLDEDVIFENSAVIMIEGSSIKFYDEKSTAYSTNKTGTGTLTNKESSDDTVSMDIVWEEIPSYYLDSLGEQMCPYDKENVMSYVVYHSKDDELYFYMVAPFEYEGTSYIYMITYVLEKED